MRNLPPLNALRAFEAAGRAMTFRAAAEELGVTQGAVAQHVRALEARLQVQLFERRHRDLAFTAAGRAYLAAMKDDERSYLLSAIEARNPDTWPELQASLQRSFDEYQQHGFCLSLGDWDRSVNAAGVPLRLQDGSLMVLTCGAPSYLVSEERVKNQLAHQLAMLARDIERLGV